MRALKILTGVMGVLIVAGVVVLGMVISGRMAGPRGGAAVVLDEPAGSRIVQVSAAGDRVVALVQGGGVDRMVVLDLRTGAVVARMGLSH
jgi:hypothetical protein